MARPRKIEITQDSNPIEVPVAEEVEIVKAEVEQDIVPELTAEVVKPKVQEQDKARIPTPICDIAELSESDKTVLIEKRIKAIIEQTQIPFIPALIRFKEPGTTARPPMFALVEYDHRFVDEGWEFYKTNVREPYVKDYLELIGRIFNNPHKVYTRLVTFNYE